MEVPVSDTTLEGLVELQGKLRGELEGLEERREALDKEIEAKQCALDLVEVAVRKMAVQEREQQELKDSTPQVRGSAKLKEHRNEPVWAYVGSCVCLL
jgi:hypothetical protein